MFKFLKGNQLTEHHKNNMVSIFRECFGYLPWGEYLKCSNNDKHYISINDYFSIEKNEYIELSYLEKNNILKNSILCPRCSNKMNFFWSEDKLRNLLDKKLNSKDFSVVLLIDSYSEEILGYTYGYQTSFRNSWNLECSYLYKDEYYEVLRNLISEKYKFNLYDDTNIYVWNLIAIKNKYRVYENFWGLCSNFVSNIDNKYLDYIVFGETRLDIPFYVNMILSGVDNILKTEYENCLFTTHEKLSNCKDYFSMGLNELKDKYGSQYKTLLKLQEERKYELLFDSKVYSYKDFNL